MEQINVKELNNLELLQEQKKLKTDKIISASMIGLFIGVFFYGAVTKGFTFFTFFPLFFVIILLKSGNKKKEFEQELQNEINDRNI